MRNQAPLSVLYLGPDNGTSLHRARALERLGHRVTVVNPRAGLAKNRLINYWNHHTGCAFLEGTYRREILAAIPNESFDIVFVGAGELVGPSLLLELKKRFSYVIGYNIDDPYEGRDERRWNLFLKSLPLYDLVVTVRDCNVREASDLGAKNVMRVLMAADEVAHSPQPLTENDRQKWASDVAFIGTWMPERGPFLARLIELDVPLSIYGNRWERAPEWSCLRSHWRGPALHNDLEYPKAVQSAKVCLGLLSKGNRDLSTTRSFEIPSLGSVLCAERTTEHADLYRDEVEAVLWDDAEECAQKCKALLANESWRLCVARMGRERCIQNRSTNESVMSDILTRAGLGSNSAKKWRKLA